MIDAKEYLNQIARDYCLIENKLIELQQLKNLATSIGGLSSGDPVQTSSGGDRLGSIVAKIVDKEKEIDALVDKFVADKEERIKIIEQLDDKLQYVILHKHYVQLKPLSLIADEENYTYNWIQKNHTCGLMEVQKLLNNPY